ncbi:MAG: S41 family peptidase [Caldilineaceae bacterium]|nr:S41 family peptidase [Caldilineaceae bacterium]
MLVISLILGSFAAGNVTGYLARPALAQSEPTEFALFWEVWDLVLANFVDRDKIDYQQMTYGAIRGMLQTLGDDNHTVFFTPQEAEQQASSMEGSFEGIGAYVSLEEGFFTIIAPIHGSPAETAGVLAGDIVLAVNGEEITGQPEWEVISKIRGPAGTSVLLTILHAETDEPVEIEVVRQRIDIDSVLWARIPGTNLAYLQITQFAADTNREFLQALLEMADTSDGQLPVEGILLDLRNNPGGYLQQALLIGSQLLPEGEVILHERDAQGEVSTFTSRGPGMAREMPLVVLINEGSASASEILAGSLQENGRARLIGEVTLGTGTVLRPYNLSDGSVVRLGVTNWLTPDMNLIKGQGIKPNVVVRQEASVRNLDSIALEEMSVEELRSSPDRQFSVALSFLRMISRQVASSQ